MNLTGKVFLVTGGAAGIGRACVVRLAAEGCKVIVADVDAARGQATADETGTHFVHCDVGDRAQVEAAVNVAVGEFGGIDGAIANAGIAIAADFLELTDADFEKVLRVNLHGAFITGQTVAREMVRTGRKGAIVNMSSVNAIMAIPHVAPYVVSKGGLNQLTKVMALALATKGIRVNGIGPGSIQTDMLAGVNKDEEARRRVLSRTPMGRIGDPAEVASIAAFLLSEDASYLTGQTLYPDGGRLALNYTVPVE